MMETAQGIVDEKVDSQIRKHSEDRFSILIVDDEINLAHALKRMLGDRGFEITSSDRGSVAVELAREKRFDVILLDLWMPGENGLETFEQIRRIDPRVSVVMMSAMGTDATRDACLEAGATAFCVKPVEQPDFVRLLKDAAGITRAARNEDDPPAASVRGRILVADDHDSFRNSLIRTLRGEGFSVSGAATSLEAIERWDGSIFDLLLLDIHMPEKSGLDVASIIKSADKAAPIVFMTGEAGRAEIRDTLRYSQAGCLRKPLDSAALPRMVDMFIYFGRQARSRHAAALAYERLFPVEKLTIEVKGRLRGWKRTGALNNAALIAFLCVIVSWPAFELIDRIHNIQAQPYAAHEAPRPGLMQMYDKIVGYLERDEKRELGRHDDKAER